mmetsp:Transcript_62995/g.172986  ORF Transcript_62995/g.172986 Transcript_62995/m.172986 type:complete len:238 (+) Transcript_62995:294-1007(+)
MPLLTAARHLRTAGRARRATASKTTSGPFHAFAARAPSRGKAHAIVDELLRAAAHLAHQLLGRRHLRRANLVALDADLELVLAQEGERLGLLARPVRQRQPVRPRCGAQHECQRKGHEDEDPIGDVERPLLDQQLQQRVRHRAHHRRRRVHRALRMQRARRFLAEEIAADASEDRGAQPAQHRNQRVVGVLQADMGADDDRARHRERVRPQERQVRVLEAARDDRRPDEECERRRPD